MEDMQEESNIRKTELRNKQTQRKITYIDIYIVKYRKYQKISETLACIEFDKVSGYTRV